MSFWAVVQVVATHESAVAERIEKRIGYKTLVPRARFRVKGKPKIGAVFPGYLFTCLEDEWYSVKWTVGVLRVLLTGERPAVMPDDEIDKMTAAMARTGIMKLPKPPPPTGKAPDIGAPVKILTGTFRGLPAIYEGMNAHERQMVLLDFLGRRSRVELEEGDRVAPLALAHADQLRY
jgi:transcription antitermination factor NusG